jgi:hypothetical protein
MAPADVEQECEIEHEENEDIVVEELEAVEAEVEGVTPVFDSIPPPSSVDTSVPPPPGDPFISLVCVLADVAIGAGALDVAAMLPGLLIDARLPEVVDEGMGAALQDGGISDAVGVVSTFTATAEAWRGILRGTSDDFSACGGAMLDEWAADLLARLLGAPARAPVIRQELRSRGVAAFGLVEAAA